MIFSTTYPPKFPLPAMGGYRYFFNGQEADNEVLGEGVSLTAEFWQYDSRLGRRWNVDPVFKEYESPYTCFAGNPVWFADRFGADTIFDDNTARTDFLETYQWIVDQISSVEKKVAAIRAQAAQKGWNDNKTNRKIDKLHNEYEYNTLLEMKQGFEEIMNDPNFCVSYSTDVSQLDEDEGGKTHYVDEENVNVYYRPYKTGSLTHETRHAWGVKRKEWSNRGGYDTFDEYWAFTWQSVIDASAVEEFVNQANEMRNHGVEPMLRVEMGLKEAIDYIYTKKKTNIIVSPKPIPAP